jgi:hypothetical protein
LIGSWYQRPQLPTSAASPVSLTAAADRACERRMESIEGDKERAEFIFEIGTKKRLGRIAHHYGLSATALIEQWAAQVAGEVAEKGKREQKKVITTRYEHNPGGWCGTIWMRTAALGV